METRNMCQTKKYTYSLIAKKGFDVLAKDD